MILRNFISLQAFTVYKENSLRFEISLQFELYYKNLWKKEECETENIRRFASGFACVWASLLDEGS